jgi:hypothetical protein
MTANWTETIMAALRHLDVKWATGTLQRPNYVVSLGLWPTVLRTVTRGRKIRASRPHVTHQNIQNAKCLTPQSISRLCQPSYSYVLLSKFRLTGTWKHVKRHANIIRQHYSPSSITITFTKSDSAKTLYVAHVIKITISIFLSFI